ncbi:Glutamine-dependent NAD(+) synthetase [Elsinoe australis]|uniref:Glutamine-dependent NAD(+) synthetase n=1 Tax=Elsinoe australis TaxID=40998 RepID=A0A2P8A4G9_9PEZI|nr:Glutamine-dependent NAD(+) synthetase [Elsinoe australis]
MGRLATIATCQLNQWVLDFDGNRERIIKAIVEAKKTGAKLVLTPELCIPGYGLLDHFLELDVYTHSWEVVAGILSHPECQDIIIDLGLPVRHRGNPFNARVIALNKKILAVRPKIWLCNDGNYREMRYFTAWKRYRVETYPLPQEIQDLIGQKETRIGDIIFDTLDGSFATETCEELWTPDSPHAEYSLQGVEIILNSSGSHHELRKLDTRVNLILEATAKSGGVYMYANQRGCDGDRLYYDGSSLILSNGKVLAQGSQFSLRDVEVLTATIDLDDIWSSRASRARGAQSMEAPTFERVSIDFHITSKKEAATSRKTATMPREIAYHKPEEEIALGPAAWMWDYLRRSKASGYFVPLSGGIDSCATAVIVFSMCRMVVAAIEEGNTEVLEDATRLCGGEDPSNMTAQQFCNKIFCTAYMGMKEQSSVETRSRAKDLGAAIGSHHIDMNIDVVFNAVRTLISETLDFQPKFKVHGGSNTENLALQNFQSRTRMVLSYGLGQLLPTVRGGTGGLLILGSANVDEALRGYLTKYDCSSADINPIGGISKTDLKRFIAWAEDSFNLPILHDFIEATPTAELEPITSDYVQSDEADMGMSYGELSVYGTLRKVNKFGLYSMWQKLVVDWQDRCTPQEVYKKVRDFMYYYAINRHKMTTITPAYYAEQYAPDDNRYDLRPFLYPKFTFAQRKIENELKLMEEGQAEADT